MISGYIADKLGHRKLLVLVGYGLTPVGQALLALATGWPMLLLGRLVSWFGKGLRGPLRDAIVIQAVSPETRGRAFGFHRAADTVGAVLDPLLVWLCWGWHKVGSRQIKPDRSASCCGFPPFPAPWRSSHFCFWSPTRDTRPIRHSGSSARCEAFQHASSGIWQRWEFSESATFITVC